MSTDPTYPDLPEPAPAPSPAPAPTPPCTIYMTAAEAAQVLGIGRDAVIRELARSVNPLPHLKVGNTRYVRRAALEPHFAKLEVH